VLVTISLVTHSGLVIHREVIDTLQLMGATPSYIARQFEIQAFRLSLKGGVLGLIAMIPFLYLLSLISRVWQLPEISSLLPG
ncbi:FtsX-like permease family protein, partial [Acinetobacter baumannii]